MSAYRSEMEQFLALAQRMAERLPSDCIVLEKAPQPGGTVNPARVSSRSGFKTSIFAKIRHGLEVWLRMQPWRGHRERPLLPFGI